jgi:hypothetical protein
MSQSPYPGTLPVRETNGLGVAGFVCSLVGLLFTGGLLCPIGLIVSVIALGRRPRGFATAGVIIGILGTCGGILFILFAGAAVLAALGLAAVAMISLSEPEKMEITSDMVNTALAVKAYEKEHRYLPADLGSLDLRPSTLRDPWGSAYQYHLTDDKPGFDLVSSGQDGQFGTPDDVTLGTLGEKWKAGGFGFKVHEEDDGGRVTITIGDRTVFTATEDDDGGRVTLDLGDRVIEIIGDESGGRIHVEASEPFSDERRPPEPPEAPAVPDPVEPPSPDEVEPPPPR